MTETQRGLLLIDQCPACRALWFDGTELERYARSRRVYDDAPRLTKSPNIDLPQTAVCPRCTSEKLQQGTWRGITMAVCPRCNGVFLTPAALRAVRGTFGRTERPDFQRSSTDDGTGDWIDDLFSDQYGGPA